MTKILRKAALVFLVGMTVPAKSQSVVVGHLVDYTGPTSSVGKPYGQGAADAMTYINNHGGVSGQKLQFATTDYGYNAQQALAAYKRLVSGGVIAIQGWGTADTEALAGLAATDKVPYYSASYSGHLTDPTGKNPETKKPAPYNFFYGPSYSDSCRGLVQWAADDWKKQGKSSKPKYVHMGDNHPYPLAPKAACEAYAKELGFEVLPPIIYTLAPGDFKAQCLSLKQSEANYAFLGNTSGSNISLLKSCETVGTQTRFMANIFGFDENALKAAGTAANGVVVVASVPSWDENVTGMALVREISKLSDPSGVEFRPSHYIRGVCSTFYMKEAMEIAAGMPGALTGANVKQVMEQKKDWVPAGLEGVCLPSTWTETDHRGLTTVLVYQAEVAGNTAHLKKAFTTDIPRKPEWLGQ